MDPATGQLLGHVVSYSPEQVADAIAEARTAQAEWAQSSFAQRRLLLRVLQRYILEHAEAICRVAARDSGKALVDAAFGELMVTCEKIAWLLRDGERHLRPETRAAGAMVRVAGLRTEGWGRDEVEGLGPEVGGRVRAARGA